MTVKLECTLLDISQSSKNKTRSVLWRPLLTIKYCTIEKKKKNINKGLIRTESIHSHLKCKRKNKSTININLTDINVFIQWWDSSMQFFNIQEKKETPFTKHPYIVYRILVKPVIFPKEEDTWLFFN